MATTTIRWPESSTQEAMPIVAADVGGDDAPGRLAPYPDPAWRPSSPPPPGPPARDLATRAQSDA